MTGLIHILQGETVLESRRYNTLTEQRLIFRAANRMGASSVQVVPDTPNWKYLNPEQQSDSCRRKAYKSYCQYWRRKGIVPPLSFNNYLSWRKEKGLKTWNVCNDTA